MTLLRMLAFAPDDDQARRVARARPEAAGTGAAADVAGAAALTAAAPAEGVHATEQAVPAGAMPADCAEDAEHPAGGGPAADAWHEMVSSLALSGVARMIAEHSELVSTHDRVYRLRLDSAHDTLLSDAPVAAIERALADRGQAVAVEVEIGPVRCETPAQRVERLRAERQRAAEETLAADATVQGLLREFDGRLEGVRPID